METRPVAIASDRSRILALIEAVEDVDGQAPLSEHKYVSVAEPDHNRTVGIVGESGESIVAYAALVPATLPGEWGMELVVDPDHRTVTDIGRLMQAAESQLIGRGAERLRLWLYGPGPLAPHLIERDLGFTAERRLLFMRRPLPMDDGPTLPDGLAAAGFRVGQDEEAWLAVNNAAFASHPENGGWTRTDLDERLRRPWFDPEGFRLVWDGGVLAGFCWTKIHPQGGEGEIYVIAIAPSHQGRGLGREVVLEGMRYLGEAGAPAVFLYSEATNRAAVALYHDMGFEVERVHRSLIRRLGQ